MSNVDAVGRRSFWIQGHSKGLEVLLLLATCLVPLAFSQQAAAQVDGTTEKLIQDATDALFQQLPKDDFAAERAFMAPELSEMISDQGWAAVRRQIVQDAGSTPAYVAYQTTYYDQGGELAAVDFYGQAWRPETFVCGFVLWRLYEAGDPKFVRLEQNVVHQAAFRSMPAQQAAQLLADWRCPVPVIEKVLGAKVR